jgi:hypothetical protein
MKYVNQISVFDLAIDGEDRQRFEEEISFYCIADKVTISKVN